MLNSGFKLALLVERPPEPEPPPPNIPLSLSCNFLKASSKSGGPSLPFLLPRPLQGSLSFPGSFQAIIVLHIENKTVLGIQLLFLNVWQHSWLIPYKILKRQGFSTENPQ